MAAGTAPPPQAAYPWRAQQGPQVQTEAGKATTHYPSGKGMGPAWAAWQPTTTSYQAEPRPGLTFPPAVQQPPWSRPPPAGMCGILGTAPPAQPPQWQPTAAESWEAIYGWRSGGGF